MRETWTHAKEPPERAGWITFCNVLMEFMPHLTDRGGTTMDISPPPLPPPPHFNPLGIPTASTIPPIPASVDTMQMQMQMQQSMAALPAAVPLTARALLLSAA